jgi:hypothetical protein
MEDEHLYAEYTKATGSTWRAGRSEARAPGEQAEARQEHLAMQTEASKNSTWRARAEASKTQEMLARKAGRHNQGVG